MTTETETPTEETPYDRTSGPIHTYFGLSYANFLVVHRAQLQSMPTEWQAKLVELLEDLNAAYAHLDQPFFEVKTVRDAYVSELSDDELTLLGIERGDDGEGYYEDGRELNGCEHVGIPVPDPIPHYRRAYLPPDEAGIEAARQARNS